MKKSISYILMATALLAASGLFSSCEKVSPQGVLMGNTSVDDRVKQSLVFYTFFDDKMDKELPDTMTQYSFLVGSDSHITFDPGRLEEMIDIGIAHDDLFFCHLGDLADTKPEYYANTSLGLGGCKIEWMDKYLEPFIDESHTAEMGYFIDRRTGFWGKGEEFTLPFYPVVGNHDITHNGWALFCDQFNTSFYEFTVKIGDNYDRFIFLDSANGTLGKYQIEALENNILGHDGKQIRHTFTFTHTNIFRPSLNEFASTYCREELYYILDKLADWRTAIAFWGHVHAWDDRKFGEVRHITMPSMNFVDHPNGGDDLIVRVTVYKDDREPKVEPVGLYCKERSKEELEKWGYYVTTK